MSRLAAIPTVLLLASLAVPAHAEPPPAPKPANPDHLRMALVNLKCRTSDGPDAAANRAAVQANLARHLLFIDRLAADGAEFLGFPELSLSGYSFSKTMTWLTLDGPEVKALRDRAAAKRVYVSAGLPQQAPDGKRWNTHIVIDPAGRIIGRHHKIWLTKEKDHVEPGTDHNVFEVKGVKMGILTCADGTDRKNLQALVDNGAKILYGPHANTTGGTTAGWSRFRAAWGGRPSAAEEALLWGGLGGARHPILRAAGRGVLIPA